MAAPARCCSHASDSGDVAPRDAQHFDNAFRRYQHHTALALAGSHPNAILDAMRTTFDAGDLSATRSYLNELVLCGAPAIVWEASTFVMDRDMIVESRYWATKAASLGHIQSMRCLVEDAAHSPSVETWTWIYLSRLLGSDVTAENLRAYHDGGQGDRQEYDDDMGGAMYVDGDFALQVPSLSEIDDEAAQPKAKLLLSQLESTRSSFN